MEKHVMTKNWSAADAFEEDAISVAEALEASPRFLALVSPTGLAFRLEREGDAGTARLHKAEVLDLLAERLEAGNLIQVVGPKGA
jgi:hypothetical protein